MSILLIIGTFEALFLAVLVVAMKNKTTSDLFLGLIFFVDALSIGFAYLQYYNIQNSFPMPWALNIGFVFMYLHGPALWFYIRSLSAKGLRFRYFHLAHFLPFIVFFSMQVFIFVRLEPSEKIQIILSESFKETNFYKTAVLCIGASTISYYLWGLRQLQDHRKHLKNHFSKIDDKDLNWLKILIIVSLITYGVNHLGFNLDLIFKFASFNALMMLSYGFASVYILILGFFGLRQGNIIMRPDEVIPEPEHEIRSFNEKQISNNAESKFAGNLLEHMIKRQPYLDPEITLSGLSSQLRVQPDYLSTILNRNLNRSFFDFINSYRIEEFKIQALEDKNSHLSIMGLAYDCGFNSKAAFYRTFHKMEKVSPGDYIMRLKKK